MNNKQKKHGYILLWIGFFISSLILMLDGNAGFGTYTGCIVMIIISSVAIYNTFKSNDWVD